MITYNLHHVKGLFFELLDDEGRNREYDVKFLDKKDNSVVYESKMKPKTWVKLDRKYLSDIAIIITFNGRIVNQINLLNEIRGKRVFITFDSKALGDNLAWMPYCLEFAKHYDCKVVVSTFKNFLFDQMYPELEFVDRGVIVNNLFGMFELGWFWDKIKELEHPATIPLQKSATNILALPFKEVRPRMNFIPKERPIAEKYVCISIHSTSGLKLYPYWKEIVAFLQESGYKVIEISNITKDHKSYTTQPELDIPTLEDTSLENTINYIYHSEFYMGLSSGLSWLAWSLQKRVYMISNFTTTDHEFTFDTIRIYDNTICNGCWNNPKFKFDKSNWQYCPEHEDTPRQFECHKLITPDRVIKLLKENENI